MSVIDTATIKLISEVASYIAGMQSAAEGTKETKKAVDDLKKSGEAMGKFIAGAATGLFTLGAAAVKTGADIHDLSQKTGLSAEFISTLRREATLAGVGMDGLKTAGAQLSRQISAGNPLFKAMGVALRASNGDLRTQDAIMSDVIETIGKYKGDAEKTAAAMSLFGRAGADLIPMFNALAEKGIKSAREETQALGQEFTQDFAAAADEVDDAITGMRQSFGALGLAMAKEVVPGINRLVAEMNRATPAGDAMTAAGKAVGETFDTLSVIFFETKSAIEGVVNVFMAAGDTILGTLQIISGGIGGMIYYVRAAQALAGGDYNSAVALMKAGSAEVSAGWEEGSQRVKSAWDNASTGIQDSIANNSRLISTLLTEIDEATGRAKQFANVSAGVTFNGVAVMPTVSVTPPQESAPNGAGLEKAAAEAEKLREEMRKLNAEMDGGIKKIADMATGFVEAMTPMQQVEMDYGKAVAEVSRAVAEQARIIEEARAAGLSNSEVEQRYIDLQMTGTAAIQAATAARVANGAAAAAQMDVTGRYVAELTKEAGLIGKTTAAERVEAVVLRALADAKKLNVTVDVERIKQQALVNEQMRKTAEIMAAVNVKSPFQESIDQIKTLREEIERLNNPMSEAFDPARVEELNAAIREISAGIVSDFADSTAQALSSVQTMTKEGTSAYAGLELAIQAANLVAGIAAILNQAQGDPYTAIPRMAAMAAIVAQMVDGIDSFSASGFTDTAGRRQASQGTGSVLGAADAKSESIMKSVEITADATSELVGLNRGMLQALQALQAAFGSAAGMLARGAGDAEFGNLAVDGLGSGLFDGKGILGRILTGSSKITDQGIVIMGGALGTILENISVGAYQEVQSRSWAFGSTRTRTGITDVTDEVGAQFQLIIASIRDTVREGAEALGLLPAEIEAALEEFRIEEIRISLKDLDAEEQQAELAAVFSEIFDGLAGAIVPFIEQFQQVGEGLGETLVRVATGVQVTQEAMRQLGLVIDQTDPEFFALVSEGLIDAIGGIQEFITGMNSFMSEFAPDAHRFQADADALATAFKAVGLTVPETRDGMWQLMQSLDATTAEGREQIATLLRLSGVAGSYYDELERAADEFVRATEEIRAAGESLAESLFGTPLSRLEAQISAMQSGMADFDSAMDTSAYGVESAVDRMRAAIQLLLGDLSPLNDEEKLRVAMEGLMAGTVSQSEVLEIGRRLYASSAAYNELFSQVQQYAGRMDDAAQGRPTGNDNANASGGSPEELAELIAQRDAILLQQRMADGRSLAEMVASFADRQNVTYAEAAEAMNFDFAQLQELLALGDKEMASYMDNLVAANNTVPDAITTNTDRLIAVIREAWRGEGEGNRNAALDDDSRVAALARSGERNTTAIVDAQDRTTAAILRLGSDAANDRPRSTLFPEAVR